MFRRATKQWFKLAWMNLKNKDARSATGDFLFGIKMAVLDVIESAKRSMHKWHVTIEYLAGQRQSAAHSFAYFLAPIFVKNNGNDLLETRTFHA